MQINIGGEVEIGSTPGFYDFGVNAPFALINGITNVQHQVL